MWTISDDSNSSTLERVESRAVSLTYYNVVLRLKKFWENIFVRRFLSPWPPFNTWVSIFTEMHPLYVLCAAATAVVATASVSVSKAAAATGTTRDCLFFSKVSEQPQSCTGQLSTLSPLSSAAAALLRSMPPLTFFAEASNDGERCTLFFSKPPTAGSLRIIQTNGVFYAAITPLESGAPFSLEVTPSGQGEETPAFALYHIVSPGATRLIGAATCSSPVADRARRLAVSHTPVPTTTRSSTATRSPTGSNNATSSVPASSSVTPSTTRSDSSTPTPTKTRSITRSNSISHTHTQHYCAPCPACATPAVTSTPSPTASSTILVTPSFTSTHSPGYCLAASDCPTAPANSVAVCQATTCTTSCLAGYANCDNLWSNGCEVYVQADPNNCQSCGNACPNGPFSFPVCFNGACTLACDPNHLDCDRNPTTGCEVNVASDPSSCGSCGLVCLSAANAGPPSCSSGTCQLGACNPPFANCDGNPAK